MEGDKEIEEFEVEFPVKKKETIIVVVVISVFVLGVAGYFGWTQPTEVPPATGKPVPAPALPAPYKDKIKVISPLPGAIVTSPFVAKGEARGMWYFEASFPVKLLDGGGKVLAQTHATAKTGWMTENYVPFEATVEFKTTKSKTGTLVLERDNPSALPQNADELRIPVRF